MSDDTITDLIERLASGALDSAWTEFLGQYSPLIKRVIRRHEDDLERAKDCFADVCAALSDDGFRRLRSFRSDGPARFRTWLIAVVSNLCLDWRRKQDGRVRPTRAVSRLSELDQQVYRCIYVHGMSRIRCVSTLAPRFPQLTEAAVAEVSARLFALLTPQQRWQLSVRRSGLKPMACGAEAEDDDPSLQVADPGAGPDDLTEAMQVRQQLQDALAQLPTEQRLLLRLRYEQDLTLAEVARLMRLPDPFRANRQIHAALDALAGLVGAPQDRSDRKTR